MTKKRYCIFQISKILTSLAITFLKKEKYQKKTFPPLPTPASTAFALPLLGSFACVLSGVLADSLGRNRAEAYEAANVAREVVVANG